MSDLFPTSLSNLILKLQQEREEKLKNLRNSINPKVVFGWDVSFSPIHLASKFIVIRSWQEEELRQQSYYDPERKIIKIDPGVSFGWANATTDIMLQLIEKYWQGGNLLDVGTGTGILSIASALTKKASKIDAFDISENIVNEASRNIKLNNLENIINTKLATIDDYPSKYYDLVLANLLSDIHQRIYKKLFDKVKKGGYLIASGFPTVYEGAGRVYFDWESMPSKGEDKKVMEKLFKSIGLKTIDHCSLRNYSGLVFQK